VLAIAGIKGGKRAEISSKTKNIIIESANFHPVSVRRTANRLNLRNESSRRFENEIIPELAGDAMSAVSSLILESSPGALFGQITDEFVKPTPKRTVTVSAPFVMGKLGMAVNEREVKEVIDATGSEIAGRDGEIIVIPPLDRLDLRIPEDFVDEVARIKGYDRMTSVLPPVLDRIQLPVKSFYVSEKTKNILCGAGYSEVLLYSLVEKGAYNIEYPLASDKSALRESIVPKMLESLKLNAVSLDLLGSDTIKIFEIGKVFPESGEKTVLTLGVNLLRKKKGVTAESVLGEAIVMLEQNLGLKLITNIVKAGTSAVAECDFDGVVGGLSSSGSLQSLDFAILPRDIKYKPFSLYPFITRDVAVFVPKAIKPEAVWQAIEKTLLEKNVMDLVARHSLFDVFEKDGKTSFAYRLVFQSMERTLKDEEIGGIMTTIYEQMKQKGWEVR
jgi:phenylalanyl-tRNA synthetase beta chain